jgi:hypothetical protein
MFRRSAAFGQEIGLEPIDDELVQMMGLPLDKVSLLRAVTRPFMDQDLIISFKSANHCRLSGFEKRTYGRSTGKGNTRWIEQDEHR